MMRFIPPELRHRDVLIILVVLAGVGLFIGLNIQQSIERAQGPSTQRPAAGDELAREDRPPPGNSELEQCLWLAEAAHARAWAQRCGEDVEGLSPFTVMDLEKCELEKRMADQLDRALGARKDECRSKYDNT